ncbi:3-hydroxyacyl-CoA dehydrogenase family protein [Nannocystis sp. ILAH1]|uniref:3-hydroxyacyl-CoA dehydrogenase family protein n=1 Tax=unclassified Nannocystis TaxID=2627009 RepID=UPI002271DD7D|nr:MULTISPECIES: 3-hydroxyacyl-CoA dehydrogenase family protein [unclassified Nannocystis]MCY0991494.1 3-hydroxyacyl-CoA dehydrogenase family protein [Nannocystis sp. ILAH1]MCY1066543.1 3-hydroxyacyl-CoA dehydrogenase family protein [Nannocystis sp. RBIL2]
MTASAISTVAVIGAGTMGHGIAQVAAAAGFETRLYDVRADLVEAGLTKVRANLDGGVAKGKVTEAQRAATLAALRGESDLQAAVTGADIVVEAVPEKLALKQELFTKVAAHVAATAVLATNTSSLSVTAIAAELPHPERVIGTHFFNPVHVMKLLEIVVGQQTAPEVLAAVQAWGAKLGKDCIVVRDSPGFATSRLGLVIGLEAIRMVEEKVASAEDIDKAMCLGYGFPMGPLKLTDLVGLDVRLNIAEYLAANLQQGDHFRPPALLREMVAAGKLGKKSGEGFYKW